MCGWHKPSTTQVVRELGCRGARLCPGARPAATRQQAAPRALSAGVRRGAAAACPAAAVRSVAPVLGLEVVDGHVAPLPGPDAHGLLDGEDEDLAVADLAGAGGGGDRLHHRLDPGVDHDRLHLPHVLVSPETGARSWRVAPAMASG